MEPSDLALLTTHELIDELTRRTTFLGVVIHSEEELKGGGWGPERMFKVRFNSNLSPAEASRLLEAVAEYMNDNCSELE